MAQYASVSDGCAGDGEESVGLAGALARFDGLRARLAEQTQTAERPRRAASSEVVAREAAVLAELTIIHDAVSEGDQLRIYRFFLTAVHRNALSAHRFDKQVISFPGRAEAMDAELAGITNDLDDLVGELASHSRLDNEREARLQAAAFLWTTVWWLHTRVDVLGFKLSLGADSLVFMLLGREPDLCEAVVVPIYQCARRAELEYRKMLALKKPENQTASAVDVDFTSHVPMHMRSESHL